MTRACEPLAVIEEDRTCDLTVDDHLDSISDLLPSGRAWPRARDTVLMRYWRAFAEVVKDAEDLICSLADEFYLETTTANLDRWAESYGVDDILGEVIDVACLNIGADIDATKRAIIAVRLAQRGGNTLVYLQALSDATNFSAALVDTSDLEIPVAGCAMPGYTFCGPTAEPKFWGSNLGRAGLNGDDWYATTIEGTVPVRGPFPGILRTGDCVGPSPFSESDRAAIFSQFRATAFGTGPASAHPEPNLWERNPTTVSPEWANNPASQYPFLNFFDRDAEFSGRNAIDAGFPGLNRPGSQLGQASLSPDDCTIYAGFYEADTVEVPDQRAEASTCGHIPGSTLGKSSLGPSGCCNYAGYYAGRATITEAEDVAGPCEEDTSDTELAYQEPQFGSEIIPHRIGNIGEFDYTGHAHTIRVELSVPTSMAQLQAAANVPTLFTTAGCTLCGDPCAPLRSPLVDTYLTMIEDAAPAHVNIYPEITWN